MRRKALFALLLSGVFALLLFGDASARAVSAGLSLCLRSVIPSLFPFFVVSSLLLSLGFSEPLGRRLEGLMRPLFGVSGAGASALLLGLLGGYPVGARAVVLLFREKQLSREEAERLLSFCNNCSPAFVLNVMGLGIFGSSRIGALLYVIHVASALGTGLCRRRRGGHLPSSPRARGAAPKPPSFPVALVLAVRSSLGAMGSVCAFVVFFTLLLAPLRALGGWSGRLLIGFFELFTGSTLLPPTRAGFLASSLLLGWGGLCVHCQTLALLDATGLSPRSYLLGKLTQAGLSLLLALPFALFLPI